MQKPLQKAYLFDESFIFLNHLNEPIKQYNSHICNFVVW